MACLALSCLALPCLALPYLVNKDKKQAITQTGSGRDFILYCFTIWLDWIGLVGLEVAGFLLVYT